MPNKVILFFCGRELQFVIVRANVFVMSVLHSETFRDGSELDKPEAFVQVSRMRVAFDDGIELQNSEAVPFSLFETVLHEHFADVLAPGFRSDRVARI